jgi:hypothetical protein
MRINLSYYKQLEEKLANGLHNIPDIMKARQFYLSGMDENLKISRFLDVAKSVDAN